jgi:hypothetical protein
MDANSKINREDKVDEKTWDELMNEGASDGYNPYRKTSPKTSEPAWSIVMDKIDRICRKMDNTSTSDPEYGKMVAEKAKLESLYTSLRGTK